MTHAEKPWLRFYPEEVAPSYEYPKHNVAQFLVDSAAKYPKHTAVYFLGTRLTYSELLESAYRFANALLKAGIRKGDRVAIMLPNCPQSVISYFGTLLAGCIAVQTNPLYTERELLHQLNDSGARAIVTLDLLFARLVRVRPETSLKLTVITSIKDYLPFPKNVLYPIKVRKDGHKLNVVYDEHTLKFIHFLKSGLTAPIVAKVNADKDIAILQYTGGTTGVAKGVMLTHHNLIANTYQTLAWNYRSQEGKESYLAAVPCFHVLGLTVILHQGILQAGTLVLVPRFDVGQVLQTIKAQRPTIFPGAPTMYIAILNHPDVGKVDLSSIQVCISGSAPLPLEVQQRFEALSGGRLIEGYGLTEASPVTHANPVWGERKIGTIGIPFPDTDAKVVDLESGEELEPGSGAIGELLVRGPQVMKGYWNRPDETAEVLKDGWLYTGDLATMDRDGYFAIVDRKKDMIIASGYNVYPREIEEVLYEHPAVLEACAVGVLDEYRGETIKAFLALKKGAAVTEKELDAWCRERLAAYKVPRKYEFRESLPKTMVGKVLRRKLLEEEGQS